MAMGTRKIGPAVAAGCTMVIKPAKQTPLSMLALAEILENAGLPDGVLNVVTSSSSGSVMEPLIKDPRLRKLSFTGSTEVGRKLIEQSSEQLLQVSMELGGNAPFLVFDDADLDDAVEGAMIAKMRNIGEACTAANRFHVAESLADEFAEKLAERMGALKVGRGTEEGVDVGPLIDDDQRAKVQELVDDAVGKGAKCVVGGSARDGQGYFYEPTVLADVPDDAKLLKEEIFGPVAPVKAFDSEEEAIAAANDTEYGLVAYVYTRDVKRALRVCEALEYGMVGLNQGMVSNPAAPVRRHQAVGLRARGRLRGHRGVPRDQVRGRQPLIGVNRSVDRNSAGRGLKIALAMTDNGDRQPPCLRLFLACAGREGRDPCSSRSRSPRPAFFMLASWTWSSGPASCSNAWNDGGPDAIGAFARDDVVLVEREDVLERDTILGKARRRRALPRPARARRAVDRPRSAPWISSTRTAWWPTWTCTSRGGSAG